MHFCGWRGRAWREDGRRTANMLKYIERLPDKTLQYHPVAIPDDSDDDFSQEQSICRLLLLIFDILTFHALRGNLECGRIAVFHRWQLSTAAGATVASGQPSAAIQIVDK